jgi:hypothetical protein
MLEALKLEIMRKRCLGRFGGNDAAWPLAVGFPGTTSPSKSIEDQMFLKTPITNECHQWPCQAKTIQQETRHTGKDRSDK